MSTSEQQLVRPPTRAWGVAGAGVFIGLVMAGAAAYGGQPWTGLAMFVVMVLYAAILLLFQKSETVALLAEESTDERRRLIQLRAGYFALNIVAVFCVAQFLLALMFDRDAGPWAMTSAVAAVSFLVALVYHSRRS